MKILFDYLQNPNLSSPHVFSDPLIENYKFFIIKKSITWDSLSQHSNSQKWIERTIIRNDSYSILNSSLIKTSSFLFYMFWTMASLFFCSDSKYVYHSWQMYKQLKLFDTQKIHYNSTTHSINEFLQKYLTLSQFEFPSFRNEQ